MPCHTPVEHAYLKKSGAIIEMITIATTTTRMMRFIPLEAGRNKYDSALVNSITTVHYNNISLLIE